MRSVVFSRSNFFCGIRSKGIPFAIDKILSSIWLPDCGSIIFTCQETTSGIGHTVVVKSGFHIAAASVCTDPNHSDNEGATIKSALATNVRSCFWSNHLNN